MEALLHIFFHYFFSTLFDLIEENALSLNNIS